MVVRSGFFFLVLLGCAAAPRGTIPRSRIATPGRDPASPIESCRASDEDYALIANYQCPDGRVPLRGDVHAGGLARLRNIGPGPDGHIVDEYEVPCQPAVRVYIDAYHCPVQVELDPNNYPDDVLARLADVVREVAPHPFVPRADVIRREMIGWMNQSPQVEPQLCEAIGEILPDDSYQYSDDIVEQFLAEFAASTIDGQLLQRIPNDVVGIHLRAIESTLIPYDVIVQERGPVAQNAAMVQILAWQRAGELERVVREHVSRCAAPAMAYTMTTDDENVWPPRGPECERLVRCCESNGWVVNGAGRGPTGMSCLLGASTSTSANSCETGLRILEEQGHRCAP